MTRLQRSPTFCLHGIPTGDVCLKCMPVKKREEMSRANRKLLGLPPQPAAPALSVVYVVEGVHPIVPGEPMLVCATKDRANIEALSMVNTIMDTVRGLIKDDKDFTEHPDLSNETDPAKWQEALERAQETLRLWEGVDSNEELSSDADVWITELKVQP